MHGIPSVCLLLWIVTLSLLSSKCNGVTYYVTPNSTTPCPSEPCHVLNYYAHHHAFNTTNARFVFLPGNHTLNTTIVVENVQNLTLTGDDRFETDLLGLPVPSSQIHCNRINGTGFDFENLSNLNIDSLLFSECVHEKVIYSHKFPGMQLMEMIGALTMHNTFNSTISMVTIQQSPGSGIVAVNLFGSITDSIFLVSNNTLAYFAYRGYNEKNKKISSSSFVMSSSRFLYGSGVVAGGLRFEADETCPNVTITINNITAIGNVGLNNGQMSIQWNTCANSSILVANSYFVDGHADSTLGSGGGLNVYIFIQHTTFAKQHFLAFVNCTYQSNSARVNGGAASIGFSRKTLDELLQAIYRVSFVNCIFMNNTSTSSVAQALLIYSMDPPIYSIPYCKVTFNNCTFSMSPAVDTAISNVITLVYPQNITFSNCTFEDNFGAAIVAINSIVTFDGSITFQNNSGTDGGALVFYTNSYMFLQNNAHIHFINNHAEHVGGAIYVHDGDCITVCPCFFQVPVAGTGPQNIMLSFGNNTAAEGGTALYGGQLGECAMMDGDIQSGANSWKTFEAISGLHNSVLQPSTISSDPIGVCFCTNNTLHCHKKWNNITVYPGQSFNISAITVGQRNGTVRRVIRADIDQGTIDNLQGLQSAQSYQNCTNLTYTVFSQAKSATLTLTVSKSQSRSNLQNFEPPTPPKVHIVLKGCPAGFTLEKYTPQPKCDCVPVLKKHHISCDINEGTVHRPASSWIGYHNGSHDNETSGLLYYAHCPLDYCRHNDMDIHLNNSDEQCAFNHSGILCGSCKPGLSLALGTPQCQKCSNTYLTLLIPFGVAGLALVLLLIVCNLTVTEGTLNGLIFYANIIWVNKAIFFPSNNLTVFIAWVNLDLGIQTCFYDGMDAYGKTWLQFAFPLYIWTLVGLIIYLSRYRVVNRLIGQNAVKALATLFLLSYAKLQRAIIAALSFTFILHPNGSKMYLWLYDGNVDYFTGKQIPLLMAGLAFLFFMSLPYTLALLFIGCIRRIATPRYRFLRWIVRLSPLFDAYTAPYKPRYQFWTGFLLLVRNILFLVFAINYSNDPALNLMAIVIASHFVFTLAWSLGGIYKNQPLNILESSFILNLGTVSVIVLYTGVSQSASAVGYTSTGVAFATFVGIILYHCYKQLSKTKFWRGFRAAARSQLGVGRRAREDESEPLLPETDSPEPMEGEMPHLVSYSHYRESMLEQLSDPRKDD